MHNAISDLSISKTGILIFKAQRNIYCPIKTAKTHSNTLAAEYITASGHEPESMSPSVSSANDENVVNPPQNPTFSNKSSLESSEECLAKTAAMHPIINAPSTFMNNVFTGHEKDSFIGIFPIKYLRMLPKIPPIPTAKQLSTVKSSRFNLSYNY